MKFLVFHVVQTPCNSVRILHVNNNPPSPHQGNGLYSLLMEYQLAVSCTGEETSTHLVVKMENCHQDFMDVGTCKLTEDVYTVAMRQLEHIEMNKTFEITCRELCDPPCENLGSCLNKTCYCHDEYFGVSCECQAKNPCTAPCSRAYCWTRGTCQYEPWRPGVARCECKGRWSGSVCVELNTVTSPPTLAAADDDDDDDEAEPESRLPAWQVRAAAAGSACVAASLVAGAITYTVVKRSRDKDNVVPLLIRQSDLESD